MKKIQVFNCNEKERPYSAQTVIVVDDARAYPFTRKDSEGVGRILQRLKSNYPLSFLSVDVMHQHVENLTLVHEETLDTEN